MTDYISFDYRPDRDDAPDACQYVGCDDPPYSWVHFRDDPDEYVCYCQHHTIEVKSDHLDAKSFGRLR